MNGIESAERAPASPLVVQSATLLPPDRFHCRLDDQPAFLVPEALIEPPLDTSAIGRLIVNSNCWLSSWGSPPGRMRAGAQFLDNFYWGDEAVWVGDTAPSRLLPFALGPAYRALVTGFRPGAPPPHVLPSRAINTLALARVLVSPEGEARRREDWRRTVANGAEMFRKGYAAVAGLLHPFHISALRRYYRYRIRKGLLQLGDVQSARRYVAHNESIARFFHHQLTAVVGAIVGETVKPSYVFLASYQSGADLPRHTDRPQCEFSVSLLVDFSPEPERQSRWPILLETPSGVVTIHQAIGDGLVYRGRDVPHYRDRQPEGCTSTSLFFHYVRESFDGPLD